MKIIQTPMFEVPLYHIKIDNWKEKKKLLLTLFSTIEHNVSKVEYYGGGSVYTDFGQTTNPSEIKLYNNSILNILKNEIELFIYENNLKYNKNHTAYQFTNCWFEKGNLENYHPVHNHGAYGYSAVCFINYDPKVHKPTKFQSPFLDFDTGNIINYFPPNIEEGSMIIFPAAIAHSTVPSHVNVNRLILSFNLDVK